jgi:hypothetical protein
MWPIFAALSIILLLLYRNNKNLVWGGMILGMVLGMALTIVSLRNDNEFVLFLIGKFIIYGTFTGFAFELIRKILDFFRYKK